MKYKQMLKIRKTEKDPQVRDRILLNVLVKRDGMSVTGAALHLGIGPDPARIRPIRIAHFLGLRRRRRHG